MALTSAFGTLTGKTNEIVVPLFGTETGITIKFSCKLGWERETKKKFSRCLGKGFQDVPVGKYTGTGIPAHVNDSLIFGCSEVSIG